MSFASRGRSLLRLIGRRRVVVPALTFAVGLGAPSYWVFGGPAIRTAEPAELMAVVDPTVRLDAVPSIPASENAYPLLAEASEDALGLKVDVSRLGRILGGPDTGKGAEFEYAKSVMKRLGPLFDKIDVALARPEFQVVPDDRVGAWERLSVSLGELGKLEQYRARVCSATKDSAGALHAITALRRMSGYMSNGNGPLPMYTQGFNAKCMMCAAIRWAIHDGGMEDGDLRALLASLPPEPTRDEPLAHAVKVEFSTCILPLLTDLGGLARFQEVVAETDGMGGPLVGNLDYLTTIKEASRLSAIAIANARKSWAEQDESVPDLLTELEKGLPRRPPPDEPGPWLHKALEETKYHTAMRLIPNSLGRRMLIACLNPAMTEQESFLGRAYVECARLQIALEVYRRRHGALPQTIEPLVSEGIVAALPVDPFSGGPVHYDRLRGLVWSASFNAKDDGGKGGLASTDGVDIVFHVSGGA